MHTPSQSTANLEFRELIKKVGSGEHTSKDLTRSEAATAMQILLQQSATPAQIGAFLIAHRIKRPSPEELAGMLDTYNQIGPQLQPLAGAPAYPVTVFSIPYDGRSRTAPVTPITALILAAAGVPIILHGGDRMPTKYGIPLVEIWQGLGVDFSTLALPQTQHLFEQTQLGFIYLPQHFPLAHQLVPYRDQIGKRPPIATLELIWSPYAGEAHLVSGFVHPPTEDRLRATFDLLGEIRYTTVKGLEGSCDLPCSRPAIIGVGQSGTQNHFERLHLHAHEYGLGGKDVELESSAKLYNQLRTVLAGRSVELMPAAIWNGGFYLWNCGVCPDLEAGINQAEQMLTQGVVAQKLEEIIQVVNSLQLATQI